MILRSGHPGSTGFVLRRGTDSGRLASLFRLLPHHGPSTCPGCRESRFDAACAWLAWHGDRPGPVLTRHPGEVFLATGRQSLEVSTSERQGEPDASPDAIARTIARHRVAYLLIDEDRYLNAPSGPLGRFVAERPQGVRRVWSSEPEGLPWRSRGSVRTSSRSRRFPWNRRP